MDFDDLDAQPGCRIWDIVVYGATGVTGCLIVEHLDNYFQQPGVVPRKWAIAGRSKDKLTQVAKHCKTEPGIITVEKPEELDDMTEICTVVIAAAGPYLLCGQRVVEACVKNNTHYLDVTGEIVYNRRIIDAFHEKAKEKGIMIIVMVGTMSVLTDMNHYLLAKAIGPLKRSREYICCTAGVRGGGSFYSGFSQFENMNVTETHLMTYPFGLGGERKCGVRDADKDRADAERDPIFPNVWASTSFVGHPGVRVARRSCELFEQRPEDGVVYGEECLITSCDCTFQEGQARMSAQMAKPPEDIRKIISNAASMEDGLKKGQGGLPGYGPPRATRAHSRSQTYAVGENEQGEWAHVEFSGPEAYEFTSIAAAVGALTLVEEGDLVNSQERGGVVTPAFAFHGSNYLTRLGEYGWICGDGIKPRFEVKMGPLPEEVFEAGVKAVDDTSKAFQKRLFAGEFATCEPPELLTGAHLAK